MTVEVLIYRAMRVDADWSSALILAILQMAAILFISVWLRRRTSPLRPRGSELQLQLVSSWLGLPLVLAPTLLILTSLFNGVAAGWREFWTLPSLIEALSAQFAGSLFTGTLTGLSVALMLLAFAYLRPTGRLRRWLLGYAAPSSVLVGLSLLIVWRATGVASLIKISLGLALILTPALYRMQWDGLLQSLEDQVRVASSLGADASLIFREVMLPQLWGPLGVMAGLASLWAWGDFALSTVIAERELTLALTAQALMDSYRLDVATVYIWMIAVGGLVSYALFTGVGRVLGSTTEV